MGRLLDCSVYLFIWKANGLWAELFGKAEMFMAPMFQLFNAIDHIINSVAKSNYMSAGQINVPIVFWRPNGVATGCFATWYDAYLGLKLLAPYSSEDDRGLLKAAIRDLDLIVFLENELLYGESCPISVEVFDSSFCLPIGKAKVEREGKDVMITTFSRMVGYAIKEKRMGVGRHTTYYIFVLAKEGPNAKTIQNAPLYACRNKMDTKQSNTADARRKNIAATTIVQFPQVFGDERKIGKSADLPPSSELKNMILPLRK
ncbi:hypothetical protein LOK49_LG04G00827, partial [Camellia lanceoleosa]